MGPEAVNPLPENDQLYARAFELARAHGTPLFLFCGSRLAAAAARFQAFMASIDFPVRASYSYKTNYLPALCNALHDFGFDAEITSTLEWNLATQLVDADGITVNGLGKTRSLIREVGLHPPRIINVETDSEIDVLEAEVRDRESLRVGIRVCFSDIRQTGSDPSEELSTMRRSSKFGWELAGDAFLKAVARAVHSPVLDFSALQFHLGGQIVSADLYLTALDRLLDVIEVHSLAVGTVSLGGGLASGWVAKRRRGPLFDLMTALGAEPAAEPQREPELEELARGLRERRIRLGATGVTELAFEPGRILAEPAMMLVAQVLSRRIDGERIHVVLDAGVNMLPACRSDEERPVVFEHDVDSQRGVLGELVGPLCHRGDRLGGSVPLPADVKVGSLVCIDAVGAYTFSDWVANAWLRPGVLDIHSEEWLWAPQTEESFWSGARIPVRLSH